MAAQLQFNKDIDRLFTERPNDLLWINSETISINFIVKDHTKE